MIAKFLFNNKKYAPFLFVMLFFVPNSYSYFNELNDDEKSLTISIAGQEKDSIIAATSKIPIKRINGFAGLHISRQTGNNKKLSEIINFHIQGSTDLPFGDLQFFLTEERDHKRNINWLTRTGYYYRPTILNINKIQISLGAGNFSETITQEQTDLVQNSVNFGWIAIANISIGNINTKIITRPDLKLNNTTNEISITFLYNIGDNLSLNILTQAISDNSELCTSYLFGITYHSE